MTAMIVEDTARYEADAAAVYAAFGAMPNATAVVDHWNALQGVARAVRGRTGMRVVELGCGAGQRTVQIAAMPEVAMALGLDYSDEQLALARSGPQPARVRFDFADVVALGSGRSDWARGDRDVERQLGTFDVVLMEFVTCHAGTQTGLDAMMRAAAAFLARGGQLVVVDGHPRIDRAPFPSSERYGVSKRFLVPDGRTVVPAFTKIRTTFHTPVGELSVEDYFHDVDSWTVAVARAGLRGLSIDDAVAPPHPEPGFWDAYIRPDHPSASSQAAVIRATKPAR